MALLEKLGFLGSGANDQQGIASKEEIERRRKLAQMLMQQGSDTSPVQDWTQGAARLAQALDGSIAEYQATKSDRAAQAEGRKLSEGLFGGLGGSTPAAPATPVAPAPPNVGSVATPPGNIPEGLRASPGLLKMIDEQNAQAGLPAGYLSRTAQIESGMNPTAKNPNSSASGLFQFIDSTRKQYGGFDPMDPAASTQAAARLASDNKAALSRVLGREPTAGELYLAHQQGAGGASKLLGNPNARAADLVGADAVRLNGGSPNMTATEFAAKWTGKFSDSQPQQVAQASPGPAMPQQGSASDPTLQQLLAARNNPAFDRAPAGTQALVNALIQKKVTQETKDPLAVAKTQAEITNLNLGAEKTRRELGRKQIDTQIVDGQLYERTEGGPWKLAIEAKGKAKFREYNGRIYQENEDGTLQDRTPEGAGAGYTPMTPDQRKAFNVPEGTPAFMAPDGKPQFGPASRAEQGTFSKKSDEAMAEYFKTHAEGGGNAVGVMQGMQVLREIGQMAPQGGITGRLANAFPGFNTAADVFNSQVKTLAPQLRIPGSGATSDKDLDTFMAALPSLKNTPEANRAVLGMVEAKAKLNLQRSEIARQALRGEIDKNEADKQIRVLDRQSVLTPEARKALGLTPSAPAGAAPSAPATQPGTTPPQADGWQDFGGGVRIREKGAR